ncbi:MAG TPA: tetratricopeptide repeat protein [Bryobacteraceae bacterium]|jgi:Flp pilus assembly protein TadD
MSVKTPKPLLKPSTSKGNPRPAAEAPKPARHAISRRWIWAAGFGVALVAALIAYWPSMHGSFVFDDVHQQFATQPDAPLRAWLGSLRQLVALSFWFNYQVGGADPFGYHLLNVFLHTLAALMVFLVMRKILEFASQSRPVDPRRRTFVAIFCASLFLLHPVQTEAVAYISSRSEQLSVALAFAAWACFLYRRSRDITFPMVAAVLLLFGASVGAKEHVAVLPAVLLLTDYYWNPGFTLEGARRNWRLYGIFLIASLDVAAFFYSYLKNEPTVGEVPWYEYIFTQCRVLFLYARLFVLPFGLNADYATELSRTPLEHGAIFGMLALIGLAIAAIVWRRRFPLASYGLFVALLFFLPTSVIPIRDLAAERRLYLPMIGLLFICAEFLLRVRWPERRLLTAMAAVVLIAGVLTWNRSFAWSSSLALWSDTVEKSPGKSRPHHGLAEAEYGVGRYADAIQQFKQVDCAHYHCDGVFYSNWGLALNGAGQLKEAQQMGRKAIDIHPSAETYGPEAMYLAEDGDTQGALDLLEKAEKLNPNYQPTYIYRGNILGQTGRREAACAAFQKAWTLNPKDASAYKGLGAYGCSPPPR